MELRTQYTQTAGGVTLAYMVHGSGPVLISIPSAPVVNFEMELELPGARRAEERMARAITHVRFDLHGFGNSQRDATDFSIDSFIHDIDAIADRAGAGTFMLEANGMTTPIGIAYAARRPERVSKLLLVRAFTRLADIAPESVQNIVRTAETDWTLATEALARVALGWSEDELATRIAAIIRAATTPESMLKFFNAAAAWDVRELAPLVQAPTLIIAHREGPASMFLASSRRIAAQMPNARLVELGPDAPPRQEEREFWDFAGMGEMVEPDLPRRPVTASILFADIADSTALTEKLGDAAFRARARELDGRLRGIIGDHAGEAVEGKLLGDGVLATFSSAHDAIAAGAAIAEAGTDAGLPLHTGVHAGDVIRERGNVFGGAVNVAARIASAAAPGDVLVSDVVRALARTSMPPGIEMNDRGEQELKGVSEPLRLYRLQRR